MVVRLASIVLGGMLVAGCTGGANDPSFPAVVLPTQLQISCPAAATAETASGSPIAVTYPPPTAAGGVAPLTTTCTPASGTPFALGTTTVNCTARDSTQRGAICEFNVTVKRPGTLTTAKFMAFGDSITEGSLVTACPSIVTSSGLSSREFFLRDAVTIRAAVNVSTSYPTALQQLLTTRYAAQTPSVTNVGLANDRVTDSTWGTNDATIARLKAEMTAYTPQVVLLMEGANDVNANNLHPEVTVPAATKGLRDLAREAKQRGATVLLATVTPQQPGACRGYAPNAIAPLNDSIRAMVAADHHVLVDVFAAFGGVPGQYLGIDGLHPNQLGYQKIAQTFFETIQKSLEVPR